MEKVEQQWEDAVEVKITDQNLNTPNACSLSRSPSSPPLSFTQSPFPPRSVVRDGQTSPHKSRLVVRWSLCGWFGVRVGECFAVVMEVSAIATRSCICLGLRSC
jgi:hypothetical protein